MRPVRLIVAKRGFEIFEMCNDWFSRLLGISMKCCFTKQCNIRHSIILIIIIIEVKCSTDFIGFFSVSEFSGEKLRLQRI